MTRCSAVSSRRCAAAKHNGTSRPPWSTTSSRDLLAVDAEAAVIVLGDINDFEFSETVNILKSGNVLGNLIDLLPPGERYTYVFEGNSQVLDQTLASPALMQFAQPEVDAVHINSEFAAQLSDHDPPLARFALPRAGDADGDGDVDLNDLSAIASARNTNTTNPFDPRDLNADDRIDVLDARLATNACTRPRCAP